LCRATCAQFLHDVLRNENSPNARTALRRSTKNPSQVFRKVLKEAEEELFLAARSAANFQHRGIRGNERAGALAQFLSRHLPNTFAVGKGEAIDYRDARTGELDLFVYDTATASPIQTSGDNALVPAEALYAVIEVKSVLSQTELNKSAVAAAKVRALKPFKHKFCPSPTKGEASDENYRCLYIVFAYTTDLSEKEWPQKEFDRMKNAVSSAGGDTSLIDRIVVLDRGMIRPQVAAAKVRDELGGIFLEFYIHLVNFLMRERRRRPSIDWAAYASSGRWLRLK
jgi:hypothetical protein